MSARLDWGLIEDEVRDEIPCVGLRAPYKDLSDGCFVCGTDDAGGRPCYQQWLSVVDRSWLMEYLREREKRRV